MPSSAPVVSVVGMRALRRDLNRAADDVQSPVYRAIKDAGKQAAEPVAARARSAVPRSDTNHGGRLSGDIRVSGTKTGASVRMGRKTIPYAGWIEFGGSRPDGSSRQFIRSGRYLFPAAQSLASTSAELYSTALDRVLNSDALWTNTTANPDGVTDG